MSTIPRFVPPGGELQSISIRCFQGRFLLKPSQRANDLIVGVLAKAQRRTGVKVFHVAFLSNHAHLLIEVEDALQRARFMAFVNSNVAKELGRLHAWNGRFWAERYAASMVTRDEETQLYTLRYLLAQGVKENLVEKVGDWPGVHTGALRFAGDRVQGIWVDRTGFYKARRTIKGRKEAREADFEEKVELVLSPLPCWAELSEEEHLARLRQLVAEVEAEAEAERRSAHALRPPGPRRILQLAPHHRPEKLKKSRLKLVYAMSDEVRRPFLEAFRLFHQAYREAAERLKAGVWDVVFPAGCFPPPRLFVHLASPACMA